MRRSIFDDHSLLTLDRKTFPDQCLCENRPIHGLQQPWPQILVQPHRVINDRSRDLIPVLPPRLRVSA